MEEEDKKGYIIGSDNKTGSNPDLTEEGGGDRKAKENIMRAKPWATTKKGHQEWSKDEVTAWLLYLKGYMEIEFDVQKVAIRGSAFALRTKEDMKSLTGKIVGIHIFNAKEALLKNQSGGGQQRGLANRCGKRNAASQEVENSSIGDENPEEVARKLRAKIKDFVEQKDVVYSEYLGDEVAEKTEYIANPEKFCGLKEAMVVMKALQGFRLEGDLQYISNVLWVRAETRAIHRNILLQIKYYHKRKGGQNPLEKIADHSSFQPRIITNGVHQYILLTGNPGLGKTLKIQHLISLCLRAGASCGVVLTRSKTFIFDSNFTNCEVLYGNLDENPSIVSKLNRLAFVIGDSMNQDNDFAMWLKNHIKSTCLVIVNPNNDTIRKYRDCALTFFSSTNTLDETLGQFRLLLHYLSKLRDSTDLVDNEGVIVDRHKKIGGAPRWLYKGESIFDGRLRYMKDEIRKLGERNFTTNDVGINEFSHAIIDVKSIESSGFTDCHVSWRPYPFSLLGRQAQKLEILRVRNEVLQHRKNDNQHGLAGFKFEELFGMMLTSLQLRLDRLRVEYIKETPDVEDAKETLDVVTLPKFQENSAKEERWWPIDNSTIDTNYRSANFPCIDYAILTPDSKRVYAFDVTLSKSTHKEVGNLNVDTKSLLKNYEENLDQFAKMVLRLGIINIPDNVEFWYVYVVPSEILRQKECWWRWEERKFPPKDKICGRLTDNEIGKLTLKELKTALKVRWQTGYSKKELRKQDLQEMLKGCRDFHYKIAKLYNRTTVCVMGIDITEEEKFMTYLKDPSQPVNV
eukprot:CAMPEP_0184479730 /NCGR_PEP_ID=MMETSP0113_2-20130426/1336_1 /TAXON_ID=91329 /ORGANISM="Norrisiella sphaerica, Strain BC52" /LENGTH=796 /DNA_ID=CAMNT_0026857867 /DNA_START=82 /DNA_END=2473 /DNA_ORIENTATION=-